MEERFFTVHEARRLLPVIKRLMGRTIAISSQLEEYREAVQQLAKKASFNSGSPEGTAFLEKLIALQQCLTEIQEKGCLVKEVRNGVVDFPHLKDGREVYLCWKYGEDDIHFWHEVDAGLAGRKPLLD